jgi:hypothetical protein
MELDDLLGQLHKERLSTIETQLRTIEVELAQRHVLSVMTTVTLFDQVREVNQQILRLLPEHPGAPDPNRKDRVELERDKRLLEQEIDSELQDRWKDMTELRREARVLIREHEEEVHRYGRMNSDYQ